MGVVVGGGNNTDFLGECVYFLNYVYLLKQQSILEMSVLFFCKLMYITLVLIKSAIFLIVQL